MATDRPDGVDGDDSPVDAPDAESGSGLEAEPSDEEREDSDLEELDDDDEHGSSRWAAPVAIWIALLIFALIAFASLRIAGEQRYQSCVAAASAKTEGATDALSRFATLRTINRCSHSPF